MTATYRHTRDHAIHLDTEILFPPGLPLTYCAVVTRDILGTTHIERVTETTDYPLFRLVTRHNTKDTDNGTLRNP